MCSLRFVTLVSAISIPALFGACGSSGNGSNTSQQGSGDGGGNDAGGGSSGGSSDSGSKESGATDGPFVRADHLPFPQVTWQGGPVIAAPEIVSVSFAGDPNASTYDELGKGIAFSMWWDAAVAGYCEGTGGTCVGDGPMGVSAPLAKPAAASYTDSAIQVWLQGEITSGAVPAPDPTMPVSNTIYVLYFPSTTMITDQNGDASCSAIDGYHSALTMTNRQQIAYAVVDECNFGTPAATLASTTATTGHEVIEAATDPGNPAGYYLDLNDPSTWGWNDVQGGEVADLCVDPFGIGGDQTNDGTFTVQRIWSIPQAAAGGDPCDPIPSGRVYFNVSPSQEVYVLPVGGSVTFEASAFSTAPTSDWSLLPQDFTDPMMRYLSFSIQGGTDTDAGPTVMVNNGSKPKITMTLLADPGPSAYGEADGVLVSVTGDPNKPTADNIWPFIIVTPADAMDAGIDAAVSMRPHGPRPFNRSTRHGLVPRRGGPTVARSIRW
jgi:hypothetical protein